MTETYSAKSAAVRAARKALGAEAIPGTDFRLVQSGERWGWSGFPDPEKGGADLARAEGRDRYKAEIAAVHVPGDPANHFRLNEAGQQAVAKARMSGKHKEALEAAKAGKLPPQPDFSADTHKRWRPKLAEVVALAEAGDIAGLKAYDIKPISTSPKAIDRFRNLAVVALESRQ